MDHPVASYDPQLVESAQQVGCEPPEPGYEFRVICYQTNDSKWHDDGNTNYLSGARDWAAGLLTYEHITVTAVVRKDGLVVWNLTKQGLVNFLQEQLNNLLAQLPTK